MRSNRADAGAFSQCADYADLLVGTEYVCHAYYCITQIVGRQVFLCYNFTEMRALVILFALLLPSPILPLSQQNNAYSSANKSNSENSQSKPQSLKPDNPAVEN